MKRRSIVNKRRVPAVLAGLLLLTLAASALMQVPATSARAVAGFLPTGPVLVLEAKNFAALLGDWNNSPEKTLWLGSANYQVFSRSKLFLRLQEAHREFAAAAGFPADMPLVESVAGAESALGVYDIGSLQFLYVTRLDSARAVETALWQSRANFEPRNAAGKPYYVRADPKSGRMVAFAATDDHLFLATGEDLLASALSLMAGQGDRSVTAQGWYREAAQSARARGELRLLLNMDTLRRSPHFRSYWIQGNVSKLGEYRAGVSDIHRSSGEIREERVFLRRGDPAGEPPSSEQETAVAQLLRLVPEQAGLYRAWAVPKMGNVTALLQRKVLAPYAGPAAPSKQAPRVSLGRGQVGSEAALETLIDEPPPANTSGTFQPQMLTELLSGTGVEGMLHVQSSRVLPDGVLVGNESVLVLLASSDWDSARILEGLTPAAASLWTASQLGAGWVQRPPGYFVLDGVTPLAVATRGRYLLIANRVSQLEAVLGRMSAPAPGEGASYAAGFRHNNERESYERFMRQLDFLQGARYAAAQKRPPHFFAENIGSLSRTLARVESVSLRRQDRGASVSEVVTYRMQQ